MEKKMNNNFRKKNLFYQISNISGFKIATLLLIEKKERIQWQKKKKIKLKHFKNNL
jgi:hypothetical protein